MGARLVAAAIESEREWELPCGFDPSPVPRLLLRPEDERIENIFVMWKRNILKSHVSVRNDVNLHGLRSL
jgi:hypothetical protein